MDHPGAHDLDPAREGADPAALLAEGAGHRALDARLDEREERRREAHLGASPEEALREGRERPLRCGEGDPLVDDEPLDLVEDRRVPRVDVVLAVDAPGAEDPDGGLAALHRPHLDRRGVRPEQKRVATGPAPSTKNVSTSSRAGWSGGKFSDSKLYQSVSISGPSATS